MKIAFRTKFLFSCILFISIGLFIAFLGSRHTTRQRAFLQETQTSTTTSTLEGVAAFEQVEESDSDERDQEVVEDDAEEEIDQTNTSVVHVVDGDTLDAKIDGLGTFRIRMLGVDTPEVVDPRKPVQCFGEDASNFSKKTLFVGSRIRLAPDPEADERDMYGRLLRNVFLEDGTDYNAYLVEQGYARAYTYFPLTPSRKVQLIQLQREAKEAGRGMWGDCH